MTIQQRIEDKIRAAFQPHFLAIENESHLHRAQRGGESHFKCTVVSDQFEGLRKVARHQKLYQLLADELADGVHALALHLFTEPEWAALKQQVPASTKCAGHGH